jgi:uncharacterized protein YoxC
MNPITPWLVCIALAVMLIFVAYAETKALKAKTEEIKHLEGEVQNQKENMAYLVKHAKELAQIEEDQDKVQEEIRNAKSDEEVADIINAIININNTRVRDKAEAKG